MRVFMNPGHAPNGIPDPGAVNRDLNLRECDLALTIGNLVVDYLIKSGCVVAMLQSDSLEDVVLCAEEGLADVLVSIHCNGSEFPAAHGFEAFYYPGELKDKYLAERIIYQLEQEPLNMPNRGVKTNKSWYILRAPVIPSVLVECGFITNNYDATLMRDRPEIFAAAIARGVTDYWQWRYIATGRHL